MFNFKELISAESARKIANEHGLLNKDKMNGVLEWWGKDIQDVSKQHHTTIVVYDFCNRFNEEEQWYAKQILKGKGYKLTVSHDDLIIEWGDR